MKQITVIVVFVVTFLLAGCVEEHSNPNVVPSRVRLLGSNSIVNIKIDTTLYFIGDTLTVFYTDIYKYWGVSPQPMKNCQIGFVTYRQGVIQRWLKKSKQN